MLRGFLYLLYLGFKAIIRLYQRIYFPWTEVKHRERLDFNGPGIILGNHPNTMIDPLQIVSRSRRQVFFLANASMFKHPVANFLLNYLYCIPVSRPGKDTKGPQVSLAESFSRSFEHLAGGNVLFIAPEGGSEMERRLRPLKTGTARIALGAEAEHNFSLGLKIVPSGINYEHPQYCGSRVFIQIGDAIEVKDWQTAYEADEKAAVIDLTEEIARRMRSLIIHTKDEEEDKLLYQLEKVVRNEKPLAVADHYERGQKLLSGLQAMSTNDYAALLEQVNYYFSVLKENGLTDRGVYRRKAALFTLLTIIGAPFWAYGRLNNLLAYEVPRWLVRQLDLYIGYASTVKVLSGTVLIPIFYFVQYKLAGLLLSDTWALVYLMSLPLSAFLTWQYARYIQPRLEAARWRKWTTKQPTAATALLTQRQNILDEISSLIS